MNGNAGIGGPRWETKIGLLGCGVVVGALLLRQLWVSWDVPDLQSTLLASAVGASFLVVLALMWRVLRARRLPTAVEERMLTVAFALPLGLSVVAVGLVFHLAAEISAALGLAGVGLQARRASRAARDFSYLCLDRPDVMLTMAESDRDRELLLRRLTDPTLPAAKRAGYEISLAAAQVAQAAVTGRPEELHEAFGVLTRHASTAAADRRGWELRFAAAHQLVRAWDVHAERHRSAPGYARALALLGSIAEDAPGDDLARIAKVGYRLAVGYYCVWRIRELVTEEPRDRRRMAEFRDRGLNAAREGLALEPEGSAWWIELVTLSASLHISSDPDAGIAQLRPLLPHVSTMPLAQRGLVHLALAHLLVLRYDGAPEADEADLDEAEALVRELVDLEGAGVYARTCLHDIAQYRAEAGTIRRGRPERPRRDPCKDAREAYTTARGLNIVRVTAFARAWAECAAEHGLVREAADAYWALVHELPRELELRHTVRAARRLVGEMQAVAAEAGHWLLADGRPQDAVVALELARAVLLSQRTTRVPAGLREELLGRGLGALWRRFENAAGRLEEWDREEYGRPAGSDRDAAGVAPDRGLAIWSAYRRVVDELRGVLGAKHALLEATSIEQVRRAARNGTLVYVFAARDGGGALLVGRDGEVTSRRLPDLTSSTVQAQTEKLQELLRRPEARAPEWEAFLEELRRDVVDELVDAAGADATIVLVAVGGLALLPLHAAAQERLIFRYAPSARTLLTAESHVEPARPGDAMVVVGLTEQGPGDADRRADDPEAAAVAELYAGHGILETDPTAARCLDLFDAASAWHFTGHAKAFSADPAQGCLFLADGPLRLADVLARRLGSGRLAVLSACETNVPAAAELDEAITFPAVLLAGGMRTIVATSWRVDRTAAFFFSLRFHQLMLGGHEPADAAAAAVSWLRRSDNGTLENASRGRHKPPAWATTPDRLEAWRALKPCAEPFYWATFTVTGG